MFSAEHEKHNSLPELRGPREIMLETALRPPHYADNTGESFKGKEWARPSAAGVG